MQVQSLGQEDPLEEERATHSSMPAWEIPWAEEPGGLQSMGVTKSQTRLSTMLFVQDKGGGGATSFFLCIYLPVLGHWVLVAACGI